MDELVAVAQVVAAVAAAAAAWAAWAAVRAVRQEHDEDRQRREADDLRRWHEERRRRVDAILAVLARLQRQSANNITMKRENDALMIHLRFLLDGLDPSEVDQLTAVSGLVGMELITPEAVDAAIEALAQHEARQREV